MAFLPRLFLAAVLALPFSTFAQTSQETQDGVNAADGVVSNGQRFGAWTVSCRALAVGQTDCLLTQRVLRATDNAFVADLIATKTTAGQTLLFARVPTGVHFPTGFVMRVAGDEDEQNMIRFVWQTCSRDLCEAAVELTPDQTVDFSAAENQMVAAFRPNIQSEPFVFQVSLSGLQPGLQAIRP